MIIEKSDPCFFGVDLTNNRYQVLYELTNCCNLECKHCFNKSNKDAHAGLKKDNIFTLIDELAEIKINALYLTGGEPTCYQYFNEVIKYLNKKNIKVILASNAYDIDPYIECIRKNISSDTGIFISIDGINEVHDEFRNKKGAFHKTVQNIKLLIEHGISVRISSVIWKKNIHQIEQMVKLAKSLGAYQIHFTFLIKVGRAKANSLETSEDYKKLVNKVKLISKKHSTDLFLVSLKRERLQNIKSKDCKAGTKVLHINSNGQISPCPWLAKSGKMNCYSLQWKKGNLKECIAKIQSFSDIITVRKMKYGYSGCPAMALLFNDDLKAKDPLNELLH